MKVPYSTQTIRDGLRLWPSCEVNHGIYVWTGSDFPEYPLTPLPDIPFFDGKTEHIVSCLLQEMPENGSDIHHFNVLHKDFVHAWIRPLTHTYEGEWKMSKVLKHIANLQFRTWLQLCGIDMKFTQVITNVEQIGPGIVHLTYHIKPLRSKITIIQTVMPIGPYLNQFHHMAFSDSRCLHLMSKLLLKATCAQVNRDVEIWNKKKFLMHPKLVREDRAIMQYRRWFKQFYSGRLALEADPKE